MAKRKDKDPIIFILIGAGIVYLLTRSSRASQQRPYYNYPTIPPAPSPTAAQAWAAWAQTIIQTFGNVASLWQPGGPFYGKKEEDVWAAINQGQWV